MGFRLGYSSWRGGEGCEALTHPLYTQLDLQLGARRLHACPQRDSLKFLLNVAKRASFLIERMTSCVRNVWPSWCAWWSQCWRIIFCNLQDRCGWGNCLSGCEAFVISGGMHVREVLDEHHNGSIAIFHWVGHEQMNIIGITWVGSKIIPFSKKVGREQVQEAYLHRLEGAPLLASSYSWSLHMLGTASSLHPKWDIPPDLQHDAP